MKRRNICMMEIGVFVVGLLFCKTVHPETFVGVNMVSMFLIIVAVFFADNLIQYILVDKVGAYLAIKKGNLGLWLICIIEFGTIWLINYGVFYALGCFESVDISYKPLIMGSCLFTLMHLIVSKFPEIMKHPFFSLDDFFYDE